MDHTHIVHASDLDRYAVRRDSQAVIPELVYLLLRQSCCDFTTCRIPYGDAVNQPGWDGLIETEEGFLEFVPAGTSYWEIGTGDDPQKKATTEFRKRTESISAEDRAEASFVFVTPRSSASGGWTEPKQRQWLKKRKDKGWRRIVIIDGVKLADWLREFPALGNWMAQKLSLTIKLGGLSTPAEHWDYLNSESSAGDPPIPPALFTVGRASASEALHSLFDGNISTLMLFAEGKEDVADFVAGFLAGLTQDAAQVCTNRCLYISDEQAWRSIVETRSSHVLVAHPQLGLDTEHNDKLITMARRKGHAVVVPLCGAFSGSNPDITKLRSPSRAQIESVLKEAGFSEVRAKELARIGGDHISALRRYLRGYPALPPYATWDNATFLAQAGMAGSWDASNPADRQAIESLLGKEYGEWIETLKPSTVRSDSPLIQYDEKWRIIARSEAWSCLGNRITNEDLERFQKMAINVLGERDPQFDLPIDERFAASVHGKVFTHSNLLRKGIAETLALLGSQPKMLTSCRTGKAETTAVLVVRNLLANANWERWASLNSVMPLLAEAAPGEFLDAVESALMDLKSSPFHKVFTEEGAGSLGGANYMCGLLWALEALAWSPDFLSRVAVILADMASIDPGGNWSNRPSNSLTDIFLPWHIQTTASFGKRKAAIEAVLKEQEAVGWKLLMALMPHNHGITTGCHQPVWRNYIPRDWTGTVLKSEYQQQIVDYIALAVNLAKTDTGKLRELVTRLADLPQKAVENLLDYLASDNIVTLHESERVALWEALEELVRRHRKFSDTHWALPTDIVNRIAETAKLLTPISPEFKYHRLFSGRDFDLYDDEGTYEEQRLRLAEYRQNAINEIIGNCNVDLVLEFATKVSSPYEVGKALGIIASDKVEEAIFPELLDSKDETVMQVVSGFILSRFWSLETDWVDDALNKGWSPRLQAKFLTLLPFNETTWTRVATHLKDVHEDLYWQNVTVNPYEAQSNLAIAIEKLLKFGRPGGAVMCAARSIENDSLFNEELATRSLLEVISNENGIQQLNSYDTVQLIKYLQKSETVDQNALFEIEWNFLPWLDRSSSGSPITLEKRLASDPAFFAELIALVYRPSDTSQEDSDDKEPSEYQKSIVRNAYRLLSDWSLAPGTLDNRSFSANAFKDWLQEVRKLTEESGHGKVAQIQIGQVLTNTPEDPDGLWINKEVAEALDARDTAEMRSGFTIQLFNRRGVHQFTHGREERRLAAENREKAEALEMAGYTRFATAMREFAEQYERDAEREEKSDRFNH